MARPRKEDRIALLAAARALMGERLMCPLAAVDDGGLLIGAVDGVRIEGDEVTVADAKGIKLVVMKKR